MKTFSCAEMSGVSLLDIDIDEFRRTMDRHAVCVIRNERPVSDAEHVEFSRRLGPLLPMKMLTMVGKSKSRFAHPEIIDIGNIDAEGRLLPEDDRLSALEYAAEVRVHRHGSK